MVIDLKYLVTKYSHQEKKKKKDKRGAAESKKKLVPKGQTETTFNLNDMSDL